MPTLVVIQHKFIVNVILPNSKVSVILQNANVKVKCLVECHSQTQRLLSFWQMTRWVSFCQWHDEFCSAKCQVECHSQTPRLLSFRQMPRWVSFSQLARRVSFCKMLWRLEKTSFKTCLFMFKDKAIRKTKRTAWIMLQNLYAALHKKLECLIRDFLLKGKAQYGWPPSYNTLFCKIIKKHFSIKSSWSELVTIRRSIVDWDFL
jgi:hypothetical protein